MYAGQRTEIPGGFQPELLLPGKHYLHSLHVQSFASQGSDIGAESRWLDIGYSHIWWLLCAQMTRKSTGPTVVRWQLRPATSPLASLSSRIQFMSATIRLQRAFDTTCHLRHWPVPGALAEDNGQLPLCAHPRWSLIAHTQCHTQCLKKLCKIVFVRTSSNFYRFG